MPNPKRGKIVLPPARPEETIVTDDSAAEDLALRTGLNLKEKRTARLVKKVMRDDAMQDHLHRLIVFGLYIISLTALGMFLVLAWHMATPCQFLEPDQLDELQKFLFTGAVGAGFSEVARKYILNSTDKDEEN